MWLVPEKIRCSAVKRYQQALDDSRPRYIVVDGLFDSVKLASVMSVLHNNTGWKTQKHTYSELYVDDSIWGKTISDQKFVKRDVWNRTVLSCNENIAKQFLEFLRSDDFMNVLSGIFQVQLTDVTVAEPDINTNYFRLSVDDFIEQHADDSPGREVCMLLYLNENWNSGLGGELCFSGENQDNPITIEPIYNRCVLFDPSSEGSEHWVKKLNSENTDKYRYNVTSWYWSE